MGDPWYDPVGEFADPPIPQQLTATIKVEDSPEWRKKLADLNSAVEIQMTDGNWDYNPYMHGMANGMIFCVSTLVGREPKFLDAPEMYRERTVDEIELLKALRNAAYIIMEGGDPSDDRIGLIDETLKKFGCTGGNGYSPATMCVTCGADADDFDGDEPLCARHSVKVLDDEQE